MTTSETSGPDTDNLGKHAGRPRWYVIQCKPRQEFRALENLERQDFPCFLPTLSTEKLRHGRKCDVVEPLFPGYLFIKLDKINDDWHAIRSTRGVIQIVRFNEYPMPVRDELVEIIVQRIAGDHRPVPYLRYGDRVLVTQGCFSDVEAIFVANDGHERVMLLMKILHHEHALSFPVASVRKILAR